MHDLLQNVTLFCAYFVRTVLAVTHNKSKQLRYGASTGLSV